VRLVYPYQANISQGQLSVLSLIGTALIGLTGGESIACQI
jgi:transcription elongation GreA/GreB family factor